MARISSDDGDHFGEAGPVALLEDASRGDPSVVRPMRPVLAENHHSVAARQG